MSLITNNELQAIGDKLARWASEAVGDPLVNDAFTAGFATAALDVLSGATSANNLAKYVLATADVDVVADLLPAARNLEELTPTPPTGFLVSVPEISAMITALNAHVKRYGAAASLDAYLTALNASTPTLRFHGLFKTYLGTISHGNTFIPVDLDIAQTTILTATTGTYLHLATIDKTKYAGAKLVAHNVGALHSTTGISVTVKKYDGTTQVLTASISDTDAAHETDLSTTTQLFYDVTAIAVSGATADDVIKIVAKTDRSILAA